MNCIHHPDYLSLCFDQPQQALSSAVLNGGYCQIRSLLNLKVNQYARPPFEPPAHTLQQKANVLNLPDKTMGMMTAASMKSLRQQQRTVQRYRAQAWVTCGLSNLLRPGDPAPVSEEQTHPEHGTINIWLHCSHPLTPAAMAEALILLTEAKTTAVRDFNLKSRDSGLNASGTGTDSHAVISPVFSAQPTLEYCGKHTAMGEAIGLVIYQTVSESIQACIDSGQAV